MEVIRHQYLEQLLKRDAFSSDKRIKQLINCQLPEGSWPDIDYTCRNRSLWKTAKHISNTVKLAQSLHQPGNSPAWREQVRHATFAALSYWVDNDFVNPNWWYNEIGIPRNMADILILVGDDLPQELKQKILDVTFSRVRISRTGQNKVWLAGIIAVRCLSTESREELVFARNVIFEELRVVTEEGIQPDWSFHQHGPQQQFGNYGLAFGDSMTRWIEVFQGTEYGLSDEQLSILRHYFVDGVGWVIWKNQLDISGCGRQIFKDCQSNKGQTIRSCIKRMKRIDPEYIADYEGVLADAVTGYKGFWRSEMAVVRRPGWYCSVKMSSSRVIGSETCNHENMLGRDLGSGVMFIQRHGNEYRNIQPLWNWRRLPGTTCDNAITDLVPRRNYTPPTDFVGVTGDKGCGLAVMQHKDELLTAHKAWFFAENAIVCLGAGISASESGQITTSIQQSLVNGSVKSSIGNNPSLLAGGQWVHHDGIGYRLLGDTSARMEVAERKGNWNEIFTIRKSEPTSGEVFSLWIDHGKSPDKQTYAYSIYPDCTAEELPDVIESCDIRILSNTTALQAVAMPACQRTGFVFHEAGQIEWKPGQVLKTNTPCIVMLDDSGSSPRLSICEPTRQYDSLQLFIGGRVVDVMLPQGESAGSSVTVF